MAVLTGAARLAGVMGWPVAHSRSPRLHGFWLERHGIDGVYLPLAVRPENFVAAVRGLQAAGFRGCNVTVPHKIAAFEICDVVEDSARRAGAVNTLVFGEAGIVGSNTDGAGFVANLRAHGVDPGAGAALVLGAGGAARAIVAALQDLGVVVSVSNRTAEKAEGLARDLPGLRVVGWEARADALGEHALVVNTTTVGMSKAGENAGGLAIDLASASAGTAVADIVYVPLETPLLAAARARGLRPVEGLGMLLHQAVPGFSTWFGVTPVVDEALRRFVAADLLSPA